MKEKIYTIPVNEAFDQKGECPFCNMYHKLDSDSTEYMLGSSYMEDDIREETDKQGFCGRHYEKLYAGQNRLGVGLMLYTHMKKLGSDLEKAAKSISTPAKKSFFSSKPVNSQAIKLTSIIHELENSCYICSRAKAFFEKYIDTYFYLWRQDEEIRKRTSESAGFCLSHFAILLEEAEKRLSAVHFMEFCDVVIPLTLENMKRVEDDVDWFTKKFDYRYNNEPWKNAKDALPRAIQKLSSIKADD